MANLPKTPSAYVIKHIDTDLMYVGSSGDVRGRVNEHISRLNRGQHPNRTLQRLYDDSPNIEVLFIQTGTREEALEVEQSFLTTLMPGNSLVNVAADARSPWRGVTRSEEMRRKLSEARTGIDRGDEFRDKMRQVKIGTGHAVLVNDVQYSDAREAGEALGLATSTIRNRCSSALARFEDWRYLK